MRQNTCVENILIQNKTCTELEDADAALPGPSRASVAPVPRKMLRIPPSLYKCFIIDRTPSCLGPDPPWPCTCRNRLVNYTCGRSGVSLVTELWPVLPGPLLVSLGPRTRILPLLTRQSTDVQTFGSGLKRK